MYREKSISLVIPAHNEEKLIGPTLEGVPETIDRVYVVDDASQDSTCEVVQRHAEHDPRVILLRHKVNKGVGAAIITGYLQSSADDYDIAVVVGGDNQMPLEVVDDLIEPVAKGEVDYSKGNRFLMPQVGLDGMPWTRFLGNALISITTKMASGFYKIYDVVDGYTAISKRAIDMIDWGKAWKGYGYPMDFLVRLNAYGLRVKDVPRRAIYLEGERQSQIKGVDYALRVTPMLVRGFFWRLLSKYLVRDFHPLFFFYLFGLILLPIGVIYGGFLIFQQFTGEGVTGPRSVVCALMIIMGIQFLLFAMLYDMQESE
ncbi:MAG: glycosyltransferase family 2 protein [Candidatus Latescibacterota bacterium]|nr:glycosyltransferase family 2 protein [Candidatus Latescibacterota bacterium]